MSKATRDTGEVHTEYSTIGPDAVEYRRFAAVRFEDGDLLVYDDDTEDAWVKSDVTVDLAGAT